MPHPVETPNRATLTRPERSSRRVARKRPLAWLPWALLALLLLLVVLAVLGVRAARDSDDPSTAKAATPSTGASSPASGAAGPTTGTGATGTGTGSGATGTLSPSALSALAGAALVGGGGTSAVAADAATASAGLTGQRDPGTAGTVLFDEGSAALDSDADKVVAAAATALRQAGAKQVTVTGYTDVVAGNPVNGPLSQQRADAVAAALRSRLPGVTVTSTAKGEDAPIASNDTAQGRQQNRRVAIVATG